MLAIQIRKYKRAQSEQLLKLNFLTKGVVNPIARGIQGRIYYFVELLFI